MALIFFFGMLMTAITGYLGEPAFAVTGSAGVAASSVFFLRLYPLEPRVWFATLGGLYSFAYPIQAIFGIESGIFDAKATVIASIFFLSVLGTMWVLATTALSVRGRKAEAKIETGALRFVLLPVAVGSGIYVLADAFLVNLVGVETKREIWELDVGLPFSGFASHVFLLVSSWWVLLARSKNHAFQIVLLVTVVAIYVWGSTGERDIVFKWSLMAAFAFLSRSWLSTRSVIIIGLCMVLIAPVIKDFGVVLGGADLDFKRSRQLHIQILDGEWSAATKNLEIILREPSLYAEIRMERFVADVARGLLPGPLSVGVNTSSWYTQGYTPYVIDRNVPGIGFSFSGAMWIYGGVFGVVLGGIFFGAVSWWFYRRSLWGPTYAAPYFLYIPLALWAMRGDISFLLSAVLKQVLLPALTLMVMAAFFAAAVQRVPPRVQAGTMRQPQPERNRQPSVGNGSVRSGTLR